MEAIQVSLGAVYKYEYRLIKQHCHELNIVGAFYHYFRTMFEKRFKRLKYRIDMEYNRMGARNISKEIHILIGENIVQFVIRNTDGAYDPILLSISQARMTICWLLSLKGNGHRVAWDGMSGNCVS